jgi:hypothetical protein
MPVGNNPNLVGFTGSVIQKNAFAAYTRQITKISSNGGTSKAAQHGSAALPDHAEQDTAIISREGIAALESARSIGEETVIRYDNSVAEVDPYPEVTLQKPADPT